MSRGVTSLALVAVCSMVGCVSGGVVDVDYLVDDGAPHDAHDGDDGDDGHDGDGARSVGDGDSDGDTTNAEPSGSDTEYGPTQIIGSVCPRIASGFGGSTVVDTFAGLMAAYQEAQSGDVILIRDGSYDWSGSIATLNQDGTPSDKIYIMSQSLHGVTFNRSSFRFVLAGQYNVVAGLRWTGATSTPFSFTGSDNRVACNELLDSTATMAQTSGSDAHRSEIDNNVFDASTAYHGHERNGVNLYRCNPTLVSCTHNSLGIHIHHNTFSGLPADPDVSLDHEAIRIGLGYAPIPSATTHNVDESNMDAIVENNLFDGWNGEEELISVKSSHNILRNNCVMNAPNAHFVLRSPTDNNLVTGNWFEGVRTSGMRIGGHGNHVVFNYRSQNSNGAYAFRLHQGGHRTDTPLYRYKDASLGVYRYNVFNRSSYLVYTYDRNGDFLAAPTGNEIDSNVIYSSSLVGTNSQGSYVNNDGTWSEAQFRAANSWGANQLVNTDLSASECGNPVLFEGPGGRTASVPGSPKLLGAPTTIAAPSWW